MENDTFGGAILAWVKFKPLTRTSTRMISVILKEE